MAQPFPRTTTDKRIRGRRLQRIRASHFARNPLCVTCQSKGIVRPWTQLDHVIALCNGGTDTDANRQGLCDECHEAKTARDLGHRPAKPEIGLDGYPIERAQ